MKEPAVVAIGFSAGGLAPLKLFFDNTPLDHTAYIVLSHLLPGYKSELQAILQKHSKLQIVRAVNGATLTSNRVYVLRENMALTIVDGILRMQPLKKDESVPTIDLFLASLAAEKIKKKAAIILSGAGKDGARGAKLLKAADGMVIVQSPKTCEFDGMVKNVIESGMADHVLSPVKMPACLMDWLGHLKVAVHKETENLDLLTKFGAGIKRVRIKQHVSQQVLSALCNMQKSSISKIESGKVNPTVLTIFRIANALGVDVAAFL